MLKDKSHKIFDNVFGLDTQLRIYEYLTSSSMSYNLGWSDRTDKSNLLYLHKLLTMETFHRLQFFRSIRNDELLEFIKSKNFSPFQINVNVSFPGYHYVPHTHENVYALVYYANVEWEEHWAGETIVYEDSGKLSNICVPYTPNRMLLLNKGVPHALRPPTFAAPYYRFTITMFFE